MKSVLRGEEHALSECEDAGGENLEASIAAIVQRTATDISDAIGLLQAGSVERTRVRVGSGAAFAVDQVVDRTPRARFGFATTGVLVLLPNRKEH